MGVEMVGCSGEGRRLGFDALVDAIGDGCSGRFGGVQRTGDIIDSLAGNFVIGSDILPPGLAV